MVDACPANLLAFGNTCPSNLQALKKLFLHNFMVEVLTPKAVLVKEDITAANSTYQLCVDLGKALLRRQILVTKEIQQASLVVAKRSTPAQLKMCYRYNSIITL